MNAQRSFVGFVFVVVCSEETKISKKTAITCTVRCRVESTCKTMR